MSEYRTHLLESVAALRDAAARFADVLNGGQDTDVIAVQEWSAATTGRLVDALRNAPDHASPPPSAPAAQHGATATPRRWWLNVYNTGIPTIHDSRESADVLEPFGRLACVEVVDASALEAMRAERDAAVEGLASLRRVIAKRGPEMRALNEAIENRGCYDPALTVAQNALAYIRQLGEWLDKRTESANAFHAQLKDAHAECRLKEETITDLRAKLAAAKTVTREQVEKAAAGMASEAGFLWSETNLLIDTKQIRRLAAAVIRAAGFTVEGD